LRFRWFLALVVWTCRPTAGVTRWRDATTPLWRKQLQAA